MNISRHIPDHIKRMSRSLGYFLWVGTSNDLYGVSVVLRARLTPKQRAALAFAALQSLDCEIGRDVADAALNGPLKIEEAA
jgi:hypothetical protein